MYQTSKYDKLFKNVIPNSIQGIKIFSSTDAYVIDQNMMK